MQRQPRPGPEPQRAQPVAVQPKPRRRVARRIFGALVALIVLAAIVIGVVLATAPPSTRVVLRNVGYSDAEQVAESLREMVRENTK
jgi:hypothetical protein